MPPPRRPRLSARTLSRTDITPVLEMPPPCGASLGRKVQPLASSASPLRVPPPACPRLSRNVLEETVTEPDALKIPPPSEAPRYALSQELKVVPMTDTVPPRFRMPPPPLSAVGVLPELPSTRSSVKLLPLTV